MTLDVTIASLGIYKTCISHVASPTLDSQFDYLAGALLRVVILTPPAPPTPPLLPSPPPPSHDGAPCYNACFDATCNDVKLLPCTHLAHLGCSCAGCCAEPQVSCQADSDCTGSGKLCDLSEGSTKNFCVYSLPPICDEGTIYNAQKGKCEIDCSTDRRMLEDGQLFRPPATH